MPKSTEAKQSARIRFHARAPLALFLFSGCDFLWNVHYSIRWFHLHAKKMRKSGLLGSLGTKKKTVNVMALNSSRKDAIVARREQVASLRLRGNSMSVIAGILGVSPATVHGDLLALKAEWRASAMADTAEHRARQLAEIDQVKAAAWSSKQPETVLHGIDREIKLLGTDVPSRSENVNYNYSELTPEQVRARIDELLAKRDEADVKQG